MWQGNSTLPPSMPGLTGPGPGAAQGFLHACFCSQGGKGQSLSLKVDSGKSALGFFCVPSALGCRKESVLLCWELAICLSQSESLVSLTGWRDKPSTLKERHRWVGGRAGCDMRCTNSHSAKYLVLRSSFTVPQRKWWGGLYLVGA